LAYQPDERRRSATDKDHVETIGRWVTVRQAADDVGRSVDWVRRQYRSGAVASLTRAGRYGPERLVDIHALRGVSEAPKVTSPTSSAPAASLPMLAETLQELARQLGEAQERAVRAESEAEKLRLRLERQSTPAAGGADAAVDDPPAADADGSTEEPGARDERDERDERDARDDEAADEQQTLWLAANEHFLRTLPSAAARQEAGDRLLGGRRVDTLRKARRRLRRPF
jgi:hypothetical protein